MHFKVRRTTIAANEHLVANNFRKSPTRGTDLLKQIPSRNIAKMIRNSPSITFNYEPKRVEAKATKVQFDGKYHFSKDQLTYDLDRFQTEVDNYGDLQHPAEQNNALDDHLMKILKPPTPEKNKRILNTTTQK